MEGKPSGEPVASLPPSQESRPTFVTHLHPALVSERALRFSTTLGAGIAALTLFGVLVTSGGLLALTYAPASAYASLIELEQAVPFGRTLRALHHWSADGLLIVALLHFLRIVGMAAYARRPFNWLVGLALLGLLTLSALSGYTLVGDQRSFWGASVVAGLLAHLPVAGATLVRLFFGSGELGPASTGRLFALHVTLLPSLAFGLIVAHLWRVRRDGGLAADTPQAERVPARPHLLGREVLVALLVLTAVVALAAAMPAPLGPPADAARPNNPEKAPWYFLALQELASQTPSLVVLLVLFVAILALACLPWLDDAGGAGSLIPSAKERVVLALSAALTVGGLAAAYGAVGRSAAARSAPALAVLGAVVLALSGGTLATGRRAGLRAALLTLAVAYLVFTLVGACRGANWTLAWPWQEGAGGA
jgi:quinol-cytochrome oxidoreductase complex cytochrome b subunit